jgi:DNA-binding SARP family transcriptional activator/tetratricopeptide (TPR) repeat protein
MSDVDLTGSLVDVQYRVLGPLEVSAGSRQLALGGPKQRLLLALLLIQANQVVSMDRLVSEVWPGRLPPSAQANIRTYASGIRLALRDRDGRSPLVSRHGGYQLSVSPDRLDLAVYESLVETAGAARQRSDADVEAATLERAMLLWRGTPLAGIPDSPSVATLRVYLEEQHAALVEELARALVDLGRCGQAAALLRRHVVEHPLRERGHYLLMVALHRSGSTAAALDAYRSAHETLVRELGIEPGPDLAALHRTILNGDRPADAATSSREREQVRIRPAQLPADVGVFVGRDGQLADLDEHLAAGAPMVTVITGMPGAGKTALAVRWAHRLAERFADGQLHVNLRGHATDPPLPPDEGLARFLRALGVSDEQLPHSLDERAALYRSILAPRRMLVLLDNAASADQVRPLLPGAGGSVALVTSRGQLPGLVALNGARQMALGPLPPRDSIALLARVLGDRRVRAEPDVANELARLCGHLPLALRIAAAEVAGRPDRTLADASALLAADRLRHLEVGDDTAAAVRFSFDISYRAQSPGARRLFRLVGLAPGSDISTASVAALADTSVDDAAPTLAGLVGAHLVEQVAPDRYALHDLLRTYAVEQAQQEEGRDGEAVALTRLYEHYLTCVNSAAQLLYPEVVRLETTRPDPSRSVTFARDADATAWLDAERDNLVAAVQRSALHGPRRAAVALADGLRGYFSMRMRIVDWSATGNAALAAAQADGDEAGEAATHLSLAWVNLRQSRHAEAAHHGARALACSQRANWRPGEAAANGVLGSTSMVSGRLAAAAEHLHSALELNRESGNVGGQAVQLTNLCLVHLKLGNLTQAADYIAQSRDHYRRVGSRTGEIMALADIGRCRHWAGDLETASDLLTEALAVNRDIGNSIGEAYAQQLLASMWCDAGQVSAALDLGRSSLTLARELGHPRLEVGALNIVGGVERLLGQHRNAARSFRDALRLARELGEQYMEVEALIGLAEVEAELSHRDRGLALANQALNLARQAGYAVLQGHALTAITRIQLAAGDGNEALSSAEQAMEIYDRTGHRLGHARAAALLDAATASESLRGAAGPAATGDP